MSTRGWIIVIALGGLIAASSAHAQTNNSSGVSIDAPSIDENSTGQADGGEAQPPQLSIPIRIIEDPIETNRAKNREAKSDKYEIDVLEAQQRSAIAAELVAIANDRSATAAERQIIPTWLQLFIAIIGTTALIVTLWLTRRSVKAAVKAAGAAEEQTRIAAHTARVQLRAYVSVEPRGINPLRHRNELIGHVGIKNVGARPAANVSTEVRMAVTKEEKRSVFDVRPDTRKPLRTIQPGAEMRQGCAKSDWQSKSVLGDNGNYIFVWGVVYYNDGYERRFTHFCHRYSVASLNVSLETKSAPYIEAEKARYHLHNNDSN